MKIPQITTIAEVVRLLVEKNMVVHAPSSPKRDAEIAIPLDDCVEAECKGSIFEELRTGIENKNPEYANLRYVMMQEPGTVATWCIVSDSNTVAQKYIIEPDAEDESDEWDDSESEEDRVRFEKSMPTSVEVKTADIITEAIRIREESYDKAAAEAASAKADKEREANPNDLYAGHVDFNKFYGKTLEEACREAAVAARHPNLGDLIFFTLYHAWNDASDWAKRVQKAEDVHNEKSAGDDDGWEDGDAETGVDVSQPASPMASDTRDPRDVRAVHRAILDVHEGRAHIVHDKKN